MNKMKHYLKLTVGNREMLGSDSYVLLKGSIKKIDTIHREMTRRIFLLSNIYKNIDGANYYIGSLNRNAILKGHLAIWKMGMTPVK